MWGMWDSGDVPHIIKKSQKRNAKVQGIVLRMYKFMIKMILRD